MDHGFLTIAARTIADHCNGQSEFAKSRISLVVKARL